MGLYLWTVNLTSASFFFSLSLPLSGTGWVEVCYVPSPVRHWQYTLAGLSISFPWGQVLLKKKQCSDISQHGSFSFSFDEKAWDNFPQIFIMDSNRASGGTSLLRLNPLGVFYSVVPIEPSAVFNYKSIFPVQTLVAALASVRGSLPW